MPTYDDSCYIIITQDRYQRPKISRMTQKSPSLASGEIAVKVKLSIDSDIFKDFMPTLTATVDANAIIQPEVKMAVINTQGKAISGKTSP